MLRLLGWLPILAATALFAHPEITEDRTLQLTAKLSGEGLAGRFAEALKTDWGRRAFNERLELLQAVALSGARQDAHRLWENHYFSADETGRLTLRPERQAEWTRLKNRRDAAVARFEKYSKRLDEIGARILEENDLDKAAKAGWSEKNWRRGLYNAYVCGGVPDSDHDLDQTLDTRILLWIHARPDRKLRLSEPGEAPVRQLIAEVYGLADEVKKYEGPYLKLVTKSDPATAKAASAEAVVAIACAKLSIEIRASGGDALAKLVDLDPRKAVEDAQATIRAAAQLQPRLDAVASALADDDTRSADLKNFLNDERARVLLALKLTPSETEIQARLDRFFQNVLPGAWCEAKGENYVFKRGLFRSGNGDSIETFRAYTYETWGGVQLRGMQQLFCSTAERCVDGATADVLRDWDLLPVLRQDVQRLGESRQALIRHDAVELFVKLHLVDKDGKYVVASGRETAIESLLARADELKPRN